MEDWMKRLVKEYRDILNKIEKLELYIREKGKSEPRYYRRVLNKQLKYMYKYAKCLNKRLNYLNYNDSEEN